MTNDGEVTPVAYGPPAAAKRIGISRSTLDRLIADGEIKAKRARSRVLISEDEIRRWLSSDD